MSLDQDRAGRLLGLAIALGLGLWAAWPALYGAFMYDDERLIVSSPLAHDLARAGENLRADYFDVGDGARIGYYRPLTKLGFLLQYHFFGARPAGFHAVSIAGFALSIGLLAWMLRVLRVPALAAGVTLALFATHPALGEPVGLIAAQSDLFVTAALLLGFTAYLQYRERGQLGMLALAVFAQALALAAKETGCALVGLALLSELGRSERRELRPAAIGVGALAGVVAAYVALRVYLGVLPTPGPALPWWRTSLDSATLALRTSARAFVPLAFEPYAHMYRLDAGALTFALAAAGGALGAVALAYAWLKFGRARVAVAWWVVPALLPILGASRVHVSDDASLLMACDRWIFPSVAGTAWLTVDAVGRALAGRLASRALRGVAWASLALWIAAQAASARVEVMSHVSMEESTLVLADKLQAVEDDSPLAREAYAARDAILAQRTGTIDDSVAAYRRLLALHPEHFGRHYDLAVVLARQGARAEALEEAWIAFYASSRDGKRVFEQNDSFARGRAARACLLAELLEQGGERASALRHYRMCAELDPSRRDALTRAAALEARL